MQLFDERRSVLGDLKKTATTSGMLGLVMPWMRKKRDCPRYADPNPFPVQQMFVLALCRICEPIAFMSIFPYVYYMIQSFDITTNDKQIAIYAGMVTSAFAFAEFSTGVIWGKASDLFGRKPILLIGLAGTGLSMLVFGFATNLYTALLARAIGGLLNGNIGVIQTTVAEVVKSKEHRPRAYSILPFVWCLGSIVGAGLGGCLADPVKSYPTVFRPGTIWEHFPYLLPNIICTLVVLFGLVIGILFLEETHEKKKRRADLGVLAGAWLVYKTRQAISSLRRRYDHSIMSEKDIQFDDEGAALMHEELLPPGYYSAEASPRLTGAPSPLTETPDLPEHMLDDMVSERSEMSTVKAFNGQVLLSIAAYGILAFHTIVFEQLMPVLLSMDQSNGPVRLPFLFTGGFDLPSSTIGLILSCQGIYQMAAQLLLFPLVVGKLGNLWTFRLTALSYPLLYIFVPYLVLLPSFLRMPALAFVLIWKVTFQALAYPANQLFLTNAVPSTLVLGAVNGVAASAASLARALGPTLSGYIESVGLDRGCMGLPWWVAGTVALIGSIECLLMREMRVDDNLQSMPRPSSESAVSDSTLVEDHCKKQQVLPKSF